MPFPARSNTQPESSKGLLPSPQFTLSAVLPRPSLDSHRFRSPTPPAYQLSMSNARLCCTEVVGRRRLLRLHGIGRQRRPSVLHDGAMTTMSRGVDVMCRWPWMEIATQCTAVSRRPFLSVLTRSTPRRPGLLALAIVSIARTSSSDETHRHRPDTGNSDLDRQ